MRVRKKEPHKLTRIGWLRAAVLKAALDEERLELEFDVEAEHRELAAIYVKRGAKPPLARQVAAQLMEKDALGAHAREELGINAVSTARPLQAAGSSALSFTLGAIVPLAAAIAIPAQHRVPAIAAASLGCLCALGWLAARLGGAAAWPSFLRIPLWSSLAMGVTALVGRFFGA